MKLKSNKSWLIIIGAILALCVLAIAFFAYRSSHAPQEEELIAVIRLDNKIVAAVDLNKVTDTYTQSFTGSSGNTNTVEFAHGQIRVHDATCPDQICVSQGWLQESSILPIACLPNSLIIEVRTANELGLDTMTK